MLYNLRIRLLQKATTTRPNLTRDFKIATGTTYKTTALQDNYAEATTIWAKCNTAHILGKTLHYVVMRPYSIPIPHYCLNG